MRHAVKWWRTGSASALVLVAMAIGAEAWSQESRASFTPKQINLYVGYAAGGGYDLAARLLARHYGRHLPGSPNVVVQNRPGAGSIRLANEMYGSIPADGTSIAIVGDVLHIKQVLKEPGIRFVASEFNWIGRISNSDPVFVLRKDSPATTIEEARQREVIVGVPGAGSATAQTLAVVNALLGTKFKLVSGYRGSSEVRLAVERGEVHGSGSVLWGTSREWIEDNDLKILYQVSFEKYSDLPNVPRLIDLARNEDERRLLAFFSSYTDVGRSFMAPPEVPGERVAVLRSAFMKMAQNPEFVRDAKAQHVDLAILGGKQLQKLITDVSDLSGPLLAKAREIGKDESEPGGQK